MARRTAARRPKRKLQVLICVVVAIVIILILLKMFFIGPIKEKAVDTLANQLIESQISSDEIGGVNVDTEAILNAMSEEDKDTLEGIISDNISPETIKDASSYLANGDMQGLKEYAKESLSDEEMQEIKDLYLKYKDQIQQNVSQ